MLRLAFDFIITWRETRTRPNAYIKRVFPFELRFRKNQQHKKKHPKDVYYTPPFALPYGSIAAW